MWSILSGGICGFGSVYLRVSVRMCVRVRINVIYPFGIQPDLSYGCEFSYVRLSTLSCVSGAREIAGSV